MEFESQLETNVEVEHEFAIMCGLDPRTDCSSECHLYSFMRTLWSNHLQRSGRSYPSLVESFRDPGNESSLEDFRRGQSDTMRRHGIIESCNYYPESDINQQ